MLTRSQALPVDIILKITRGYMFTLKDTIKNEFFIYKAIPTGNKVQIGARCIATEKKFTLLGTVEIEPQSLIFISEHYSDFIFRNQTDMFEKFWYGLIYNHPPQHIEIWHPCKCMRCNRRLTDPRSIERGYGPKCEKLEKEVI